jgi:hypothetical protein
MQRMVNQLGTAQDSESLRAQLYAFIIFIIYYLKQISFHFFYF